jgi:DNA-binding CsgD family transcriptional regulator
MNLDDTPETSAHSTTSVRKPTYPPPPDVGEPPDVIREWAEKVIASWGLTPKQSEVCHYMLQGFSTCEIAGFTGNSDKTLKHHIATIFKKAHVSTRAELFAEIIRLVVPLVLIAWSFYGQT